MAHTDLHANTSARAAHSALSCAGRRALPRRKKDSPCVFALSGLVACNQPDDATPLALHYLCQKQSVDRLRCDRPCASGGTSHNSTRQRRDDRQPKCAGAHRDRTVCAVLARFRHLLPDEDRLAFQKKWVNRLAWGPRGLNVKLPFGSCRDAATRHRFCVNPLMLSPPGDF